MSIGAGTTLHATMQLNAKDGGKRQCILVTNNENNICEEGTYERNKRAINGYTTPKGVEVEGLKANTLLVALPAAIYDAYQKVLPKRQEKLFEEEKKEETKIPTDLLEGQGE